MTARHVWFSTSRSRFTSGDVRVPGIVVVVVVVAALWLTLPGESPARPLVLNPPPAGEHRVASVDAAAAPAAESPARRVLRDWDRRRAAAYASGSLQDLRALYVDGAARRDVRLLRGYLRRGLRVEQMRVQVLAVEVLEHGPRHWRIRVTDRLSRAVAVGPRSRSLLPRDEPSTRNILLRRLDGAWRVAAVRP